MLFNSYEFVFFFLPITVVVFIALRRRGYGSLALTWLVAASMFFYGWWNPLYLLLLSGTIVFNYVLGWRLAHHANALKSPSRFLLAFGIAGNLGLLGYFKYANFFVDNLNALAATDFHLGTIVLPLAISFFTFQQITFLVDSYRGLASEPSFLRYCLFVSFFPQLIAGPIVHHSEMLPQFREAPASRHGWTDVAVGLTIFAIGLFKKAVLADGIATYATPVFVAADAGAQPALFEAWGGALAYTFQLYFDFSGYTDMAIGAARMVGIKLPLNFASPYKACSIIEFWRRWHMTLSRFLRDYLYIPLGGNRKGLARQQVNLMVVMLLGGLWHGAGWTFVVWGGLHGFFLVVNQSWRRLRSGPDGGRMQGGSKIGRISGWFLTFVSVVVGWVFFRATSFDGALNILAGMAGLNGISLPIGIGIQLGALKTGLENLGVSFVSESGSHFVLMYFWIAGLLIVSLAAPNTQQILTNYEPAFDHRPSVAGPRFRWRLSTGWATGTAMILASGVLALSEVSEFLYFQF